MIAGAVAPVKARGPLFYLFNTANASFNLLILQFKDDHPTCADEDAEPFMKIPAPGEPLPPIPERFKPMMTSIKNNIVLADGIIMNSFREAEKEAINKVQELPEMAHIPMFCVGPLIPRDEETNVKHQITENKVSQWLATKSEGIVINTYELDCALLILQTRNSRYGHLRFIWINCSASSRTTERNC